MAQGDLKKLLENIESNLVRQMTRDDKSSKRFREVLERRPHDLTIDRESLAREIMLQIKDLTKSAVAPRTDKGNLAQSFRREFGSGSGLSREESKQRLSTLANEDGLTPAQVAFAYAEAGKIVKDVASAVKNSGAFADLRINNKLRRNVEARRLGGDGVNSITIRLRSKSGKTTNIFDAINEEVVGPSKIRIKAGLLSSIKGLTSTDIVDAQRRFFNLGHVVAVSEVKAAKTLQAVDRRFHAKSAGFDPISKQAADVLRLQIMSRFTTLGNPEVRKEFFGEVMSVIPESEAANQTDSTYEKALLEDVKRALRDALKNLKNDWPGQKSSSSVLDVVAVELLKTAKKRGAKTSSNLKLDTKSSSASIKTKLKRPKEPTPTRAVQALGSLNLPKIENTRSSVNLQSLIPALNQKLPELVKENMGQGGRLRNRTGRFAESVEVVAISGDGLNIGFTYQTDPYAVFEGRGARDPRSLIDLSIRQAAAGIMSTKFSTGRVR
jgi:hypothetical protein